MKSFFAIVFLVIFLQSTQNSLANNKFVDPDKYPQIDKSQYLFLIDQDTKEILLEKNSDQIIAPSSMTKLMTAYVVFDQLKQGKIDLDQQCLIGKDAWKKRGSRMFLNYGDIVEIDELLSGLLIASGNDAAVALAQATAGSVEKFSDLMNEYVKKIGLKNSHFKNPHGLNQDGHYMTLRDLAILSGAINRDFPEYLHYFTAPKITYQNITQKNRNPLVRSGYRGVTGMKTGHTNDGGYGIVGTATRGSRSLIAITNNAKTSKQRGEIVTELLDYGFDEYEKITIFDKNDSVFFAKTWLGQKNLVEMIVSEEVRVTLNYQQNIQDLQIEIKYQDPIYAPIFKGQKIGTLILKDDNGKFIETALFAKENIDKANYFARIHQIFKYQFFQFLQIIKNK
ncbi:MAG: D-alanyl-D-alanine carboxypeptidase (penicillin-binding protein 5/6) [Rickettsiales bacterium]|jgi:D-alanyl-D-alanine carboxypeptidase (penicillin-binding protein 5/6)